MKSLITGGAGFIGFHLANKLIKEGHEVVLLDNFARGVEDKYLRQLEENANVTFLSLDCLDREKVLALDDDFDYIYHLAAIIGVVHVLNHPYDVLRKNIELLLNLTDLARIQKHLKRFVFASTSEIYAGTLKYFDMEIPTPENTPLAITALNSPRTSYMLSKIYGEALLYQDTIPFTVIRPHNFYGPRMGMSHVIPEQLKKVYFAKDNDVVDVFSAEHKRTFCYISDAIEMIYRLALSDGALRKSFNIGNEKPEVEIRDVVKTIVDVVGKNVVTNELPPTEGSPARRCPNMKKTYDCIGYTGIVSLREGIQKTYDWYREYVFIEEGVSAK